MADIVWGFLLRLGQVSIEAALPIAVGVVTAGVLRRMVGPAGTRRLFGRGWQGLLRGWAAGMLLPVCALGAIPVARELRRSGVPAGTVLAFLLAAPLLNPISFLYGLTLAEPVVILCFAGLSLALTTAAGLLWERAFAPPAEAVREAERAAKADAEPLPAHGPKRLLAVVVTAGTELASRDVWFFAAGLFGSALLAAVIPAGALQPSMKHSDPTSPFLMAAVAVPVYTTPLPGMMKVGLMFDHGNSLAAAFVLFTVGMGVCLGTLAYLGIDFGWKRVLPWFAAYLGLVLAVGHAADPLLYDTRKAEIDHTHAFDDYSCPFQSGAGNPESVRLKLAEKLGPLERPALYALAGLAAAGVVCRRLDRRGRLEAWLTAAPAPTPGRKLDLVVPGYVLGLTVLAGLVGFSVAGAYLYYPDCGQCLDDMASVQAEAFVAVNTGKAEEGVRHLERWDLIARKLQVGEYIRAFRLTPEQTKAPDDLREALEEVRDHLLAGQAAEAKAGLKPVRAAYLATKAAYPRDGRATSGVPSE